MSHGSPLLTKWLMDILQACTNCACFRRRKSEVYSRLQHSKPIFQGGES